MVEFFHLLDHRHIAALPTFSEGTPTFESYLILQQEYPEHALFMTEVTKALKEGKREPHLLYSRNVAVLQEASETEYGVVVMNDKEGPTLFSTRRGKKGIEMSRQGRRINANDMIAIGRLGRTSFEVRKVIIPVHLKI